MGSKYGSVPVSGYNASPPSDGGATTEENRITWTKIKSKLPDPLKTAIEAIDTALVAAFDFGPSSKSATYTTVAGDHVKTITCTSAITVNLLDASTATAGYTVNISNQSTGNVTIGRATSGDTINGSAADMTLARGNSATLRVNTAADGYEVIDTGLKDIAGLAKTDGNIIVGDGTNWVAESGATALTSLGAAGSGANTFTATQTIQSTDAGAAEGPVLVLDRDSASPAASDLLGVVQYLGEDSGGGEQEYGAVLGKIIDPTAASEDGEVIVRTTIAGTTANRLHVGAGVYTSGATGGDQGADTVNATEYYRQGTAVLDLRASQATTSGTAFDFTGITASAKRITVIFRGVSLSGTDNLLVQLGVAAGFVTTGYVSTSVSDNGAGGGTNISSTAGFVVFYNNALNTVSGHVVLTHLGGNAWIGSHTGKSNTTFVFNGGGDVSLADTLDRVRVTRTGTNTFDAGAVTVLVE